MKDILKQIPLISSFERPSSEERERIEDNIRQQSKANFNYFVLLIISAVIVALGLIIDSEATIIGGMLIAPLFWPIIALALGMMEGKKMMLTNSLSALARSFIVIFLIGALVGLISPFSSLSSEILVRTEPTIFELLIAIAAGLGGGFTTIYSKKSGAIFGVAVAVALVPPIAVAGILISDGEMEKAIGALLLFLTNFLAILLTSSFVFLIGKFTRVNTKTGEERRKKAFSWAIGSFVIILIPILALSWNAISTTIRQEKTQALFVKSFPDKTLSQLEINEDQFDYSINGIVHQSENFDSDELTAFTHRLKKLFNKPVKVNFKVIEYDIETVYVD